MKARFILIAIFSFLITSCSESPQGEKAIVSEEKPAENFSGELYKIDLSQTRVRFIGYGVGKNHPGNFRLSSGSLTVNEEIISGGKFTIDMNSLVVEEQGEKFQNKLLLHLLSADFFDVPKFNESTFEITSVSNYKKHADSDTTGIKGANFFINGNLTLKGITKNVGFPAKVTIHNKVVNANADFLIDRTLWDITYRSDKSLGDKFISENVNIEITLIATK